VREATNRFEFTDDVVEVGKVLEIGQLVDRLAAPRGLRNQLMNRRHECDSPAWNPVINAKYLPMRLKVPTLYHFSQATYDSALTWMQKDRVQGDADARW